MPTGLTNEGGSPLATLPYAATINLDMQQVAGSYQKLTLTGNVTFTTSNRSSGDSVTVFVYPGGSIRTLGFPAGWKFVGAAKPTSVAANKVGVLSVTFTGSTDADGVASWSVEA